jgi:hypothetical protein
MTVGPGVLKALGVCEKFSPWANKKSIIDLRCSSAVPKSLAPSWYESRAVTERRLGDSELVHEEGL